MKFFFFALILFFGFSSFAQSLSPGYWSAVSKFKIDGIAIPDSTGESCVSPAQAQDVRTTLSTELTKLGCVITDWEVSGNNIQTSLNCKNRDVTAKGTLLGQFSEKSYELRGKAHGFYKNIIPSVATIELTGQWVRDCPPTEAAQ